MSEPLERLRKLAQYLNTLKPDANARMHYELMSDSLMWSDELPPIDERDRLDLDVTCLRGVFHYRTSLIMGRPVEKFREGWDLVRKLSPNWPGFLPERLTEDQDHQKYFEERRAKVMADWEELDVRFRKQQEAKRQAAQAVEVAAVHT